ncbi:unnamed protein product, partial [Scytosiphon promiscuus]
LHVRTKQAVFLRSQLDVAWITSQRVRVNRGEVYPQQRFVVEERLHADTAVLTLPIETSNRKGSSKALQTELSTLCEWIIYLAATDAVPSDDDCLLTVGPPPFPPPPNRPGHIM